MGDVIAHAWVDGERSAYESFFDHDWAKVINERTSAFREVNKAVCDLCLAWKSASNAYRFPWLVPECHESFTQSFLNVDDPLLHSIIRMLRARLSQAAMSPENRPGINAASKVLDDVSLELVGHRASLMSANVASEAWQRYRSDKEFCLAIIGLMAQTYTSVVFAYEHFLLTCYRIATNDRKSQTNRGNFCNSLANAFGEAVATECWSGDRMRMHREIRNVIAHNGWWQVRLPARRLARIDTCRKRRGPNLRIRESAVVFNVASKC